MKKYLLLRNNHQSGPHSMEQLSSLCLFPSDLIWIEDESMAWKYPEEIEELKHLINFNDSIQNSSAANENVFVSSSPSFEEESQTEIKEKRSLFPVNKLEPVQKTSDATSLENLKESHRVSNHKKPIWNKKVIRSSGGTNIAAIFLGVVLGAVMIKKMVDEYLPDLASQSTAIPVIDREIEKQPPEYIKNALVTEIVPVYKSVPKKISKPGNLKKQLTIKTNDYKVGLFGGIGDLQLTVFNGSMQLVDKLIVTLDYLKPDGAVVQSENISFSSIKPLSAQSIAIPGSHRGVKVRYKILKVHAHNYKADTREI